MLTAERLREVADYEPDTGLFTWRLRRKSEFTDRRAFRAFNSMRAGAIAGNVSDQGYRRILIDGKMYLAHRLAWLYVFGVFPKEQIDHKNGERADNRIFNLREATSFENRRNSRRRTHTITGLTGVFKVKNSWCAKIRNVHIGCFNTAEEAHAAYCAAAREQYGEFARTS
jgi:hypothetical protein